MVEIIPSKYVREFAESQGWEPTSLEKAAIVNDRFEYSSYERRAALLELKAEMGDPWIIAEIDESLAREDRICELFKRQPGNALYVVTFFDEEYREPVMCGYYLDFDDACARGLRCGCDFAIEKHYLLAKGESAPRRVSGGINPFMRPYATLKELASWTDPDDGDPIAQMDFTAAGKLKGIWSIEEPIETVDDLKRRFRPSSFENEFVALPNPFELGDIVRIVEPSWARGKLGVVETSQEDWKKFLERAKAGDYWDFSDASITVEIVSDGSISHDHIAPIYLEPYDPPEGSLEHDILQLCSWMVKGEAGLDYFVDTFDKYREACNRARNCGDDPKQGKWMA